jgi:hypothetical protein
LCLPRSQRDVQESDPMDHGKVLSLDVSGTVSNLLTMVYSRQVQVMSTLPLKAISRLWGKFNELTIPYYLRIPGFKLYSFIFGVK